MKKRNSFLPILVFAVLLFVFGVWFQAHRLFTDPSMQDALVQKVQALTDGTLHFQSFQVGYFPQPRIVLERPQLVFPGNSWVIEAEQLRFDFDILPLLIGRSEPAAIYVSGGKGNLPLPAFVSSMNPPKLENFSLKMGSLRPGTPIPLQFVTDLEGKPAALSVKGHVTVQSVEKWNWEKVSGHLAAELKEFDITRSPQAPQSASSLPFFAKSGQVSALVEVQKNAGDAFLELTATGEIKGLGYEVMQEKTWATPPLLDTNWSVKGAWNNDTEELKLHKVAVKFPFAAVEANGSLKAGTGEIANLHFSGTDMVLEDLLKYCPGLENALPFHIGFSGPSNWVLSGEGTLDHLSLHLNWDLTPTLLTYAQYFSKAKDIPLNLGFDCLLQKGESLSGDFSVRFGDMNLKGNLSSLDLKTGSGQLNLITNKFSVDGWEKYIPALQQNKIGGDAKFLGNWKGDLRKLEQAEHIFHGTFDKGFWLAADGLGVKNATLSLDYSPLMLEGRQMQFEVGNSPVVADLKISGKGEKIQVEAKLTSENLKPREAWQSVMALCRKKAGAPGIDFYDVMKDSLAALFPGEEPLKQFSVEGRYGDRTWDISSLKFEGYEGQAELKGMVSLKEKEPHYKCEGEIRGLNFGRFLGRYDPAVKVLEGAVTLKGTLEGKGWGQEALEKSLSGQGDFSLMNARFETFDLKDEIATIQSFARIGEVLPQVKDFDAVDLHWKYTGGKLITDNLLMRHKDYIVDGEGTLGLDGVSNFRMEVFLSSAVAARIFPEMAAAFNAEPRAHLGPIPVLLSGAFSKPELNLDPAQVAGLSDKIARKKTADILVELVLE